MAIDTEYLYYGHFTDWNENDISKCENVWSWQKGMCVRRTTEINFDYFKNIFFETDFKRREKMKENFEMENVSSVCVLTY